MLWRRLLPRVTLAASALLASLIALELIGRACGLWRPNHAFRYNPARGYELIPGVDDVNSLGIRGPEVTLEHPSGLTRIVVLGDSFTYGDGVAARNTLPAELERQLNQTLVGKFQVLNLGVPGYNTAQEVAYFRELGQRLAPDLVIIAFTLSDADMGALGSHSGAHPTLMRLKEFIKAHVGLYDFIRLQIRAGHEWSFRNDPATAVWPEMYPLMLAARGEPSPGWVECARALRAIAADCRDGGISLGLVIWPVLERLNDYDYLPLHQFVRAQATALGVPVLDLYPSFAGSDSQRFCVSEKNPHPNAAAYRHASQVLADFLRSRPELLRSK
ncbi:MAG TPA: GDSL-type esterase/lipase family protein [Candidatus Binatia bacterium]|nr:GDSL-type esterase/lipase family protein [Candidatus Binatia bacterium]